MSKIILIGYGGHGFVAADILIQKGYLVHGYCDNEEKGVNPFNLTYLRKEDEFFSAAENNKQFSAFVSIGDAIIREKVCNFLTAHNIPLINALHPKAVVAKSVILGNGIFIAANAVINPVCSVGDGVICNTSASIDHECVIGEFTHICPGTVLCGNVTIGRNSFIGANSTVLPGKKIGDNVTVGAGSIVTKDLLQSGVYVGSPAKLVRSIIS